VVEVGAVVVVVGTVVVVGGAVVVVVDGSVVVVVVAGRSIAVARTGLWHAANDNPASTTAADRRPFHAITAPGYGSG
jgi:hypothetical protein